MKLRLLTLVLSLLLSGCASGRARQINRFGMNLGRAHHIAENVLDGRATDKEKLELPRLLDELERDCPNMKDYGVLPYDLDCDLSLNESLKGKYKDAI